MNRKLALAASIAAAVAFVSGAVMLAALLSASPGGRPATDLAAAAPDPGSGGTTSVDPVVVYEDQVEYVATEGGPAGSAPPAPAAAGAQEGSADASTSPAPSPELIAGPAPAATVVSGPPTTSVPAPATTTTTRPPGVPSDWPPGKPIPPMPTNCRQPQLEDNGVWNCQN